MVPGCGSALFCIGRSPISAIASCARRFGRKPYEHGLKSASKIGSSSIFSEACTTRWAAVGIPSDRTLPDALGIVFCRTRLGTNRRALRSSLSPTSSFPAREPSERGVIPSTPPVRAPLLPRTRRHATMRNAGSYTRLYRSSKQRPGSALAHWCSFVCITRTRRSASTGSGHGAPIFTSDLRDQHFRH